MRRSFVADFLSLRGSYIRVDRPLPTFIATMAGAAAPDDEVPSDFNDLKYSMATVLRKAAESITKSGQKRLVVLNDALNQMDDTG